MKVFDFLAPVDGPAVSVVCSDFRVHSKRRCLQSLFIASKPLDWLRKCVLPHVLKIVCDVEHARNIIDSLLYDSEASKLQVAELLMDPQAMHEAVTAVFHVSSISPMIYTPPNDPAAQSIQPTAYSM